MDNGNQKAYLIGAGIASLASAVFLIRDGKFDGRNIYIFEAGENVGGSLDGSGSPNTGYVARGGRMFSEEVYGCTFDLFSHIPTDEKSSKTLLTDFIDFNKKNKINAKARLVKNGKIVDSSTFGLSISDGLRLIEIISLPESHLRDTKISDHFSPAFFESNFWFMWCATFAFEPWHSAVEFKRYISRFIQEFPRMSAMTGVRFTRYNQHDSVIMPITNWLKKNGVIFLMKSRVTSLEFVKVDGLEQVKKIVYSRDEKQIEIILETSDLVFLTNGSMTTNSTFGSMKSALVINREEPRDSWALWEDISKSRPHFGKPSVFAGQIEKTKWESFTVTFSDKTFVNLMAIFSKNKTGTGGFTTIIDSNWLLTLVTTPQPHFINQPNNINVSWGYGLRPDEIGNFIHKKMSECTGEEILFEVCSHLGFSKEMPKILKSADCVPCMMPYITSQFMPKIMGDRPKVVPESTGNFAFIGQFCEIPDEIVFTVEQSVRSAMIAVHGLLRLNGGIPPIYHGLHDPKVIEELLKMGFDFGLKKFIPNR